MAIAYLTEGVTTMAAGNWSDTTGFASAATLVVAAGSATIAGFDNSAQTYGVQYLRVESGSSNRIGAADTPLIANFSDGSGALKDSSNTEGYLGWFAGGGFMYVRGDTEYGIDTLIGDAFAPLYVVGGTVSNFLWYRGKLTINSATTAVTGYVFGGEVIIDTPSGTNMTTLYVYGGKVTIKRPASVSTAKIFVYGGEVIYDNDSATATTNVEINGGKFTHLRGGLTTMVHMAGEYDASSLSKAVTITTYSRTRVSKRTGSMQGALLTITTDKLLGA